MAKNTAVTIGTAQDGWVTAWLCAKMGRTNSQKTKRAYEDTMASFRVALERVQLDLMGSPPAIALVAQAWAAEPNTRSGRPVSNATHNQRLAIISGFYRYLIQQYPGAPLVNPIDRVRRRPVQEYARVRALDPEQVRNALAAIDRSQSAGLRDYALLAVALTTGRRASELTGLLRKDVDETQGRLTLTFRRCKGAKQMRDTLSRDVSQAVLAWLDRQYGGLQAMGPEAPLWCSLSSRRTGKPLDVSSLSNIWQRWLGTTRIHTTRHTFARQMEARGAKLSEIAARLGHSNPNETGRYVAALAREENPYADDLANGFGIGQ